MNRQHLNTDALKSLFNAISHRNTLLRPRLQLPSLAALNPQTLHDEFKIRAIIFDVDNTLTRPYSNAPADSALATLRRCDSIFGANRVALLSNHAGSADDIGHVRAAALEQSLGARVLRRTSKAQKPNVALGDVLLQHFAREIGFHEIALVGDRVLTDVYFANRLGMCSVLVPPLDLAAEPFMVRIARRFENTL